MLKLADNLKLPADEAVTQKYGFIGRSGSGKSYASMKLAELFLNAGAQIIALDWVGIWWSLRLAANGKDVGFPNVYIFGGEHADVDLRPESGALMADLVVDKHISVVLDVMHFRKAERTRFATAFAEQFFHRKKTARSACHLFIEEAQAYLPQMVRGDEARMVGVFEDIGKVGRNYGIGNSLISQRPQAINKDVLNQVEVLLAFQTNGPQERKAIAGWTAENTSAGAAMALELPKLRIGEALVWSPQWLRIAEKVHIAKRETYDASSTPTASARAIKPKTLAKADLDELGEQIAATIEKAKADDPRELRKRIAELERQVRTTAPAVKAPSVSAADRTQLQALADRILKTQEALGDGLAKSQRELAAASARLLEQLQLALEKAGKDIAAAFARPEWQRILAAVGAPSAGVVPYRVVPAVYRLREDPADRAPRQVVTRPVSRRSDIASSNDETVTAPQQRILNALAWGESMRLPTQRREKVAFLADASPKSSAFMNNLGTLRSAGLIDYPQQGYVSLTETGRGLAVVDAFAPQTSQDLQQTICAKLSTPQSRIVQEACRVYPASIDRAELAARAGASPSSSAYMNNLGALRSLGLLDYPSQGLVKASAVLFLGGDDHG
jgi:hypothetical protein